MRSIDRRIIVDGKTSMPALSKVINILRLMMMNCIRKIIPAPEKINSMICFDRYDLKKTQPNVNRKKPMMISQNVIINTGYRFSRLPFMTVRNINPPPTINIRSNSNAYNPRLLLKYVFLISLVKYLLTFSAD